MTTWIKFQDIKYRRRFKTFAIDIQDTVGLEPEGLEELFKTRIGVQDTIPLSLTFSVERQAFLYSCAHITFPEIPDYEASPIEYLSS